MYLVGMPDAWARRPCHGNQRIVNRRAFAFDEGPPWHYNFGSAPAALTGLQPVPPVPSPGLNRKQAQAPVRAPGAPPIEDESVNPSPSSHKRRLSAVLFAAALALPLLIVAAPAPATTPQGWKRWWLPDNFS